MSESDNQLQNSLGRGNDSNKNGLLILRVPVLVCRCRSTINEENHGRYLKQIDGCNCMSYLYRSMCYCHIEDLAYQKRGKEA